MIDKRTKKEFARKLIRPFGDITDRDVLNEIEAIMAICAPPGHSNIIEVLESGRLSDSDYFYIDMPLCDLNLCDYIAGHRPIPLLSEYGHPLGVAPVFVSNDCGISEKMQNTWAIGGQIARGLIFIHQKCFAHRDLKPRNGT